MFAEFLSPSERPGFRRREFHLNSRLVSRRISRASHPQQALRIDLFRQFGATLTRAKRLCALPEISLEDLVARTTSLVAGHLRRGRSIDLKHARAFRRLSGVGDLARIEAACRDHRSLSRNHFTRLRAWRINSWIIQGFSRCCILAGETFLPWRENFKSTGRLESVKKSKAPTP
jgi:hypothetical protein